MYFLTCYQLCSLPRENLCNKIKTAIANANNRTIKIEISEQFAEDNELPVIVNNQPETIAIGYNEDILSFTVNDNTIRLEDAPDAIIFTVYKILRNQKIIK